MPARRSLLAAIAGTTLTALAGCLGTDDSSTNRSPESSQPAQSSTAPSASTDHPTDTSTATRLPTPEDCSDRYRPTVRASDASVDPLPSPDLPSELDEGSAESFATAFDRAWRHNAALRDQRSVDRITVDVSSEGATAHDSGTGYVVATSATVGYTFAGTPPSETPTAVPGPSGRLRSRYLVTERFARRVEDTNATPAAPAEGTLVACSASSRAGHSSTNR